MTSAKRTNLKCTTEALFRRKKAASGADAKCTHLFVFLAIKDTLLSAAQPRPRSDWGPKRQECFMHCPFAKTLLEFPQHLVHSCCQGSNRLKSKDPIQQCIQQVRRVVWGDAKSISRVSKPLKEKKRFTQHEILHP